MLKKEKITSFTLAMITVALLGNLRGFTFLAGYGIGSIFFFFIAAFFFLVPLSLISAELATAFPERGGIFLWIAKAFGDKWGFVATFLQWMESIIWYPTGLSFIAVSLAYIIDPAIAENKYFVLAVVLVIYWGSTFLNFKGLKFSGKVSSLAVIFGTMLPALVLIVSAIIWMKKGYPVQIDFSWKNLVPDFSNLSNIVFLAGSFLIFAGIEVSAVHVNYVNNPKRDYPKAILLAVLIILALSICGTLAVAVVLPKNEISLVSGVLQVFSILFGTFNMKIFLPVIAALISFGGLGQILSWILGPSKSMLESAKRGDIPPMFKQVNKHEIPVNILVLQGVMVTVLSLVILLMPSVSSSFWILSVLAIQDYIIAYVLLYFAALRLRKKYPDVDRPYAIPGKNWGIKLLSFVGLFSIIFVFFLGFIPPLDLPKETKVFFTFFLIGGIVLLFSVPLVIYQFKSKWLEKTEDK